MQRVFLLVYGLATVTETVTVIVTLVGGDGTNATKSRHEFAVIADGADSTVPTRVTSWKHARPPCGGYVIDAVPVNTLPTKLVGVNTQGAATPPVGVNAQLTPYPVMSDAGSVEPSVYVVGRTHVIVAVPVAASAGITKRADRKRSAKRFM